MSELLAVTHASASELDEELVEAVRRHHPSRVTILIEGTAPDWECDESELGDELRDRMAYLLAAIERGTGATVAGVACDECQLDGWRFDRTLRADLAVAA